MNKQITLSAFNDELAKVRTKKKDFLAQMDRIIPWGEWKALIQPYYYKGDRGNKPYDLELMLRLFILQNLYNLSDEGTVPAAGQVERPELLFKGDGRVGRFSVHGGKRLPVCQKTED